MTDRVSFIRMLFTNCLSYPSRAGRGFGAARIGILVLTAVCLTAPLSAKPRLFSAQPLDSPSREYKALAESEDVGSVGILRVRLYNRIGDPVASIEVPEINPEPVNLKWIDNNWVICESYLGEKGGGFLYVNAPARKGYLLEIVEPRPNADWIFTIESNDTLTSSPVNSVSQGRNSLFPILLRDAPQDIQAYYSVAMANSLSRAVEAYHAFLRRSNISELELLSDADIRPSLGAVLALNINGVPEIVYFPAGAPTPEDMFARVKRASLPEDLHRKLDLPDAPEIRVRWAEGDRYVVEQVPDNSDDATSGVVVAQGAFPGVTDAPFVAPRTTPVPGQPAAVTPSPTASPSKRPEAAGSTQTKKKVSITESRSRASRPRQTDRRVHSRRSRKR